MISRRAKLLSAIVGSSALIATLAFARTAYMQATAADHAYGSDGKKITVDPIQKKRLPAGDYGLRHGHYLFGLRTDKNDVANERE